MPLIRSDGERSFPVDQFAKLKSDEDECFDQRRATAAEVKEMIAVQELDESSLESRSKEIEERGNKIALSQMIPENEAFHDLQVIARR